MARGRSSTTDHGRSEDLLLRADELYEQAVGDPRQAKSEAEVFVAQARDRDDPAVLVSGLRALARAHQFLLAHDRAQPILNEAIRIGRREGLLDRTGDALLTRGTLRLELGRPKAARQDFEQAARLLGPDRAVEIDLQWGVLAHNAGRLGEAADAYARILRLPRLDAVTRTRAANNLGLIEATIGNHRSAARRLEEAASSAEEVGPALAALVAETKAWATVQAGRLTDGLAQFAQAADLWERTDMPLGELHAEYADALVNLRLLPEAREQSARAAEELTAHGVPLMAAEAQMRVATLALAMGDTRAAEAVAETTATAMRRQRRADWRAKANVVALEARLQAGGVQRADHTVASRAAGTLERLGVNQAAADAYLVAGRIAAALGRRKVALRDWQCAEELAPRVPVLARLTSHMASALMAEARSDDDDLARHCRRGLADLATHRAAMPTTELRALASGHGAELAGLGLGAALRTSSAARVLGWMERTRANALSAVEPDPVDSTDADLTALRAVQAEIARARRSDRSALAALQARQSEIEARIRRSGWTAPAAATKRPTSSFSVASLRSALDGRTLVEYDMYDGHVVAAVAAGRRTRVVDLAECALVDAEIDELRSALQALNVCVPAMESVLHEACVGLVESLRRMLIEPLGVHEAGSLVVVPVGELQRVPWSAMVEVPVAVAPSASWWMRTLRSDARTGRVVLAAGPGLAGAVPEVEALAQEYSDPVVLTPPNSCVDAVRAALDGAAVAHLACHGKVRTDNPTFSSLQLADGSMTVHEIDRRAGAPHRVILAACEVGGSVAFPGNEVLGFIGSLMMRGTAGVVGSTMLVLDERVTPLMLALHQGIRSGQPLAEALHSARATMDPSHPKSYPAWCAFTAYGAG